VATAAAGSITVNVADFLFPLTAEAAGASITVAQGIGLDLVEPGTAEQPIVIVSGDAARDLRDDYDAEVIAKDAKLGAAIDATEVALDADGFSVTSSATLVTLGSAIPGVGGEVDRDKVIYFGEHGDDSNDGKTPSNAKLTPAAAITAIIAESPTATNKGEVRGIGSGFESLSATLAVPANVNFFAPGYFFQTLGEFDAITVVDNSVVVIDRLEVNDDGSENGIVMTGGANTVCYVRVNKAFGLIGGAMFKVATAGKMIVHVENVLLNGNQGTGFLVDSSTGGSMDIRFTYMDLVAGGGTCIGVDLEEGGDCSIYGGNIDGSGANTVGLDFGDIRVTGHVGKIDITSGTTYRTTSATVAPFIIDQLVAGTAVEPTFTDGISITADEYIGTRNNSWEIGRYSAFDLATINTALLTADHSYELPKADGTIALTSDIVTENLAATLVAGNTTSGTNIQMTTTDAIEFGSATNTIAKNATKDQIDHTTGAGSFFIRGDWTTTASNTLGIQNTSTGKRWQFEPDSEQIAWTDENSRNFQLLMPDLATTNRTATFQDADGTVAYTADIPTNADYVDLTTNQSVGGIKTMTDQFIIKDGAGSGTTAQAAADCFVLDSDQTNAGMSILAPTGGNSNLYFAVNGGSGKDGFVQHVSSVSELRLGVDNVNSLRINVDDARFFDTMLYVDDANTRVGINVVPSTDTLEVNGTAKADSFEGTSLQRNDVVSKVNADSPYAANDGELVLYDATAGNSQVNLPTNVNGITVNIKKTDASANTVTVDAPGAETIDGGTTAVLTTQYESITVVGDGTNWFII
jgi:hypothetical protein